MDKWAGKVAVITGASKGIGANLSKKLADSGVIVIGLARNYEAIEKISKSVIGSGKIIPKKCDLTNELEIIEIFNWIKKNLGGINIFINNAGMIKSSFLIDSDTDDFRKIFDLNVMASCICLREAIKNMKECETKGHIIIINSILGHRIPDVPIPLFGVYPASKYALTALSQTVRQELHYYKTPIKLTSISPGMVKTDFLNVFNSQMFETLPKLNVDDVSAAVLYALGTPDHVQVEEIIMQAMFSYE